jgi:hypothetical protein
MAELIKRIVAVLLGPCLILDPAIAGAHRIGECRPFLAAGSAGSSFSSQALMLLSTTTANKPGLKDHVTIGRQYTNLRGALQNKLPFWTALRVTRQKILAHLFLFTLNLPFIAWGVILAILVSIPLITTSFTLMTSMKPPIERKIQDIAKQVERPEIQSGQQDSRGQRPGFMSTRNGIIALVTVAIAGAAIIMIRRRKSLRRAA